MNLEELGAEGGLDEEVMLEPRCQLCLQVSDAELRQSLLWNQPGVGKFSGSEIKPYKVQRTQVLEEEHTRPFAQKPWNMMRDLLESVRGVFHLLEYYDEPEQD